MKVRRKSSESLAAILLAGIVSAGLCAPSMARAPRGFIGDTGTGWDTSSQVRVRANSAPGRAGRQPINIISGSGMDEGGEIHDDDTYHMWLTDFPFRGPRPGTEDTSGIWIEFAFDKAYPLDAMYIWNYAEGTWSLYGMKQVIIEYTDVAGPDGWGSRMRRDWRTIGRGNLKCYKPGEKLEASNIIDFGGARARYVVITSAPVEDEFNLNFTREIAFNNDTGLSEVRFYPRGGQEKHPQKGLLAVTETDNPGTSLSAAISSPKTTGGKPAKFMGIDVSHPLGLEHWQP